MSPCRFLLSALALLTACTLAHAAPKDELHDAFAKFIAIKSFEATSIDVKKGKVVTTMHFVAPDRYRIRTPDGQTQYIVGDAMFMEMNGQTMRIPVPGASKITAQYRNEGFLREMEAGLVVKALPDETVDGQPARVYAYTVTDPVKADVKAWIARDTGLPMQVQSTGRFMGTTSTMLVRYSRFDDPSIRIEAP